MGFFVRIYMRICKKVVIYLGIKRKSTWQKNAHISCSRNDCKYTWEKTARISCHNFETNGRPYPPACKQALISKAANLVIPELRFANCIIAVRGCTHKRIERTSTSFHKPRSSNYRSLVRGLCFRDSTSFSGSFKIISPRSFYQKILR